MATLVTLDFETYLDAEYTLRKMTSTEYITDDRFHVNMVGIKLGAEETMVYVGSEIEQELRRIDWANTILLCHNTAFDAQILSIRYNIRPRWFLDTMAMAGIIYGNKSFPSLKLDYLTKMIGLEGKTKASALTDSAGLRFSDEHVGTPLLDRLMDYCADDVEMTYQLYMYFKSHRLLPPPFELATIDTNIRMLTEPKFQLDQALAEQLLAKELVERAQAVDAAVEVIGRTIDVVYPDEYLSSDPKFAKLLEAMGVEIPVKRRPSAAITKSRDSATKKLDADLATLRAWVADMDAVSQTSVAALSGDGHDRVPKADRVERIAAGRVAQLAALSCEATLTPRVKGESRTVGYYAQLLREVSALVPLLEAHRDELVGLDTKEVSNALSKKDEVFAHMRLYASADVRAVIEGRLKIKSTQLETRLRSFLRISKRLGGMMPVPLNYPGTHTLRFAGRDGLNMQNLPNSYVSRLRETLRARPGYKLVTVDSGQIEPRVTAWFADEAWMQEVFATGGDLYNMVYAKTFRVPVQPWVKNDRERKMGKTLGLSLNYNMGAGQPKPFVINPEVELSHQSGLFAQFVAEGDPQPFEVVQEYVAAYRATIPNITGMWSRLGDAIRDMAAGRRGGIPAKGLLWWGERDTISAVDSRGQRYTKPCVTGVVQLPSGVRLRYRDLHYREKQSGDESSFSGFRYVSEQGLSKAGVPYIVSYSALYGGKLLENIVQATATCVVKWQTMGMVKEVGNVIALQVHDEVVGEARLSEVDRVAAVFDRWMRTTPPWAPGLLVTCGDGAVISDYYS